MVYRVCFVVTNGKRRRKFLWITRRTSGLYIAFAGPGAMHQSYHRDGKSHWKLNGQKLHDVNNLPPLDSVKGVVHVTNASFRISDDVLDGFEFPDFNDEPVDELVYIDNRRIAGVNFSVSLVEPWDHAQLPIFRDYPSQIHLTTHTNPWLAVVLHDM